MSSHQYIEISDAAYMHAGERLGMGAGFLLCSLLADLFNEGATAQRADRWCPVGYMTGPE